MRDVPFVGPWPHTDGWYSLRKFRPDDPIPVVFGASEAAAVCGLSPYKTPLHVYMEKRGLSEDTGNEAAKAFGRIVEPAIVELYKWKTGRTVKAPCSMYFHPKHRFIAATPDAIVLDSLGEWWMPVDCKATNLQRFKREFGDEGSDVLPDDIVMQAQQQMLVLGLDRQETAVMVDRELKIFQVERNELLCQEIIERCTEMFHRVIDGDPPPPDFDHVQTTSLLKRAYPIAESEIIDASPELMDVWEKHQEIGRQVSALEKEREKLKGIVLAELKSASAAVMPDGRSIVRQTVQRKEYTVPASEHVQLREVKPKKKGR